MVKKRLALLILSTAMLACTGCSALPNKDFADDDIVASVEDVNMDYAAACTYTKMMQAETYSYIKSMISSIDSVPSNLWGQKMEDSKKTYGEQFNETSLNAIKDILIANLHKEDYGIEYTKEDKSKCEEVANDLIANTNKKTLDAMNADYESVMDVLELMTIEAKMKNKIMNDTVVDLTEKDIAQATFCYLNTKNEKEAKKIIDELNDGLDFDTVTKDHELTPEKASYTVASPEYDIYDEKMLDTAVNLTEGEFDYYLTDDGAVVIYMDSLNDKDATNAKKEELTLKEKNAAYSNMLEGWKLQDKVAINDDAWDTIKASDKIVFEKKESEMEDNGENGGVISSGDTTTSIDVTASDGGEVNASVY